jgi:hypothetical protein
MTLPNLQLNLTKQTEMKNTNTNTSSASVINNIQIGKELDVSKDSQIILKPSSSAAVLRTETPDNIKQFKEALILILISYFKNNIILLNNLVELSEKIITKIDDLKLLVSLLINTQPSSIFVDVEEVEVKNCCSRVCKHLPRYRKINDIIIDKKQSFKVAYNQYYIQIGTEFNISLEYVLL